MTANKHQGTNVRCNMNDCVNRGSQLCKAVDIDLDWFEGICKQYEPIDTTMRKTQSLDNRAKLR